MRITAWRSRQSGASHARLIWAPCFPPNNRTSARCCDVLHFLLDPGFTRAAGCVPRSFASALPDRQTPSRSTPRVSQSDCAAFQIDDRVRRGRSGTLPVSRRKMRLPGDKVGRQRTVLVRVVASCAALAVCCSAALAQTAPKETGAVPAEEDAVTKFEKSPWLLAPMFQSNPKLGTSVGALGGYLHYFDEKSRPSIFALMGQYTSTESVIAGAQARASWDEDRQRVIAGMLYGFIKNDYSDYLGTGVPLQSNSEVKGMIGRYTYRVYGNWFLGVQALYQNFGIGGETQFDQMVLDTLGVAPYKSGGAGLVAQYDSRDNENSPTQGWLATLNNMAYRESLGGESDFDVIRADLRYYMPHGNGSVLA